MTDIQFAALTAQIAMYGDQIVHAVFYCSGVAVALVVAITWKG